MLRKRASRRAAFTLIEVMVVTGIMMSQANNYGDVKRLAYQKSCENNLRQLYMGIQMYSDSNGSLPDAKFFSEHPKKDTKSLYNVLDASYQPLLVCPVFPQSLKDKGCTYLYNDSLAGQSLDNVADARKTWLMTELNAVSNNIPMPHPGGFEILYADGHIEATKTIPPVFIEMQKKIEEQQKKKGAGADGGAPAGQQKPAGQGKKPESAPKGAASALDRAGAIAGGSSSGGGE
jgi:prepilin-type processing-associated H-X9-DG protein